MFKYFFYDHKTLCRILHIFLTRNMQTSSSVVVETTPWPSIMIVATMNGISAPNFTMNATKFHITMPRKLASATLHSEALRAMQYFSCASLPCYSLLTTQAQSLQFPCHRVRQQCSIIRARSRSWEIKNAEIRGNEEISHACIMQMPAKFELLLYRRMFLNIKRILYGFFLNTK